MSFSAGIGASIDAQARLDALRRLRPSNMPAGAWRELANRQLERAVAAYREGEVDRDFAMWLVVKCSRGCVEPDRLRVRDRAAHALYGDGTMPPRTGKRKHLPPS